MKLSLGSFVTVSLSYETRPFIGTIRRINWIGKEHMVEILMVLSMQFRTILKGVCLGDFIEGVLSFTWHGG